MRRQGTCVSHGSRNWGGLWLSNSECNLAELCHPLNTKMSFIKAKEYATRIFRLGHVGNHIIHPEEQRARSWRGFFYLKSAQVCLVSSLLSSSGCMGAMWSYEVRVLSSRSYIVSMLSSLRYCIDYLLVHLSKSVFFIAVREYYPLN